MLVVRYAALAALVVWLGSLTTTELLGGVVPRRFQLVAYLCGATVFICLFVLKFVGPPPPGFVPRAGIVLLMVALQFYTDYLYAASGVPMTITMVLGFVLLFWYVQE